MNIILEDLEVAFVKIADCDFYRQSQIKVFAFKMSIDLPSVRINLVKKIWLEEI